MDISARNIIIVDRLIAKQLKMVSVSLVMITVITLVGCGKDNGHAGDKMPTGQVRQCDCQKSCDVAMQINLLKEMLRPDACMVGCMAQQGYNDGWLASRDLCTK